MERIGSSVSYDAKNYGVFIIETLSRNKTIVWWDYYNEMDGGQLEYDPEGDNYLDWVVQEEGLDIDLSDLPKYGEFKNYDEAYNYLVSKFGNLE